MPKHDPRYKAFVHHYFYGETKGNAEQSAIAAGFARSTAGKKAHSWVGNSRETSSNQTIWDMAQTERQKISEEYGITKREIMEGYIRESRFDVRKLVNDDGCFVTDLRDLDDDTALALSGFYVIETENSGVKTRKFRFKFPDKKANRDSMAKIKGMFEKDNHQKRPSLEDVFRSLEAVAPELAKAVRKALEKRVSRS
jgi:hypothetical protein